MQITKIFLEFWEHIGEAIDYVVFCNVFSYKYLRSDIAS